MGQEKLIPELDNSVTLSRRDFVALSLAVGVSAATRTAFAKVSDVIETSVDVKTPDGTCDAFFIHPPKGSDPGVLVWHDSPGLRPVIRDLGKRIAGEGYSVLVPNLFYRTSRAPVFDLPLDFSKPADREKYGQAARTFLAAGAAERDAVAYIQFLDAQPQVNKKKKQSLDYRFVDIFELEDEDEEPSGEYMLHVERVEIHHLDSLAEKCGSLQVGFPLGGC